MKKKIQKYLSGSNEGFSLVELIIVIAIMAILVGVVALAVIPYLEKSRESKDLQALDAICSALTTAVADSKATGDGSISITSGVIGSGSGATASKVAAAMSTTLGDSTLELGSQGGQGEPIVCYYDTKNNKVACYVVAGPNAAGSTSVTLGGSTVNVATCQYNDAAPLIVTN